MKKQFLLLIVAFFAAVSMSWGQAKMVHVSIPQGSTCTPTAERPVAGVPFAYQVSVNPNAGTYRWWATKDANFITAPGVDNTSTALTVASGDLMSSTSANYNTNQVGAANGAVVTITWSDDILSRTAKGVLVGSPGSTSAPTSTFVAFHYTSASGECADNFKAYEIDPVHAFTVDIRNITDDTRVIQGYGTDVSQCPAGVASATYTVGTGMQYNYGIDYMYYEVVAANFSSFWVPTYTVSGTATAQVTSIEYTYADPSTWGTSSPTWTTVNSGWAGGTHFEVDPSVSSTQNGVSVFLRMTIRNNTYEGINQRAVTLIVDGQNSVQKWDINNGTGNACVDVGAADQADRATQNLLVRPNVTPVNPGTFIPGNNTNN